MVQRPRVMDKNIVKNILSINIVVLAISMSVGLLLIAFVFDLHSYDKFHKNSQRIYRITNVATFKANKAADRAAAGMHRHP